jgi:drug/metabolite transporter (DMT)-like permease
MSFNLTTRPAFLKKLPATPVLVSLFALFFALIPISLAPALTKLSEHEIGPNAVAFHRSWIAAIVFAILSARATVRTRQESVDVLIPEVLNNVANSKESKAIAVIAPPVIAPPPATIAKPPMTKKEVGLLLITGIAATASLLLWTWSLSETGVANVALLSNLNPLFVGLAGYFWFGQKFDRRFVIGLVVALVGAVAFELSEAQFSADQIQGDVLAFVSAIFIATYLILIEKLQGRFSTSTIMMWRCGITTVFLLPLLPFIEDRLFPQTQTGWLLIIGQALFCQVLGQGLLAYSLSKLSSSVVAITLLLEPIIASIFAWFIFGEQITLADWICFVVVLGGVYLAQSSKAAVKTTPIEVP